MTLLQAYIGLLTLAGVHRFKCEAAACHLSADTGRAIFPTTVTCETFHDIPNRNLRIHRREHDYLWDLLYRCVQQSNPIQYNCWCMFCFFEMKIKFLLTMYV